MPHISNKHLKNDELKKFYGEMIEIFGLASKKLKLKNVGNEFFTKTEKIMFAKRFAVITMLAKEISNYEISQKLAMSPATVDRMSLKFEKGDYNELIKIISNSRMWKKVELLLLTTGGLMPPIISHKRVGELKKKLQ